MPITLLYEQTRLAFSDAHQKQNQSNIINLPVTGAERKQFNQSGDKGIYVTFEKKVKRQSNKILLRRNNAAIQLN